MEIKVGMYVRTKWGIARLTGECWEDFGGDTAYAVDCCLLPINETKILKEDILGEPSDNIIDLIEAGDYVNGWRVNRVEKEEDGTLLTVGTITSFVSRNEKDPYLTQDYREANKMCKIKSIVTKEQFESMSYKVGE